MGAMPVQNPLALVVLAYLTQEPMHPYQIGQLLKERNVGASVKFRPSSLYMVVDQLSRDGYIEARDSSRAGRRPERTTYAITGSGRAELRERLAALIATPDEEFPRFRSALSLLVALPPEDVPPLLRKRESSLQEDVDEIRDRLARVRGEGVERVFLLEHEHRLALCEAELAYVRRIRDLIENDPDSLGDFWRDFHR
ncbi:PadR family transcriptional regulator [Nocardioides sp. KC13]|uniref:PadR family transcriptional regulator n=2 Tax=Nocardioides turkmenicus TaxID=2711220 RepID=A0A6M1QVJ2_9ACTN|nr:PadR family transcriptional regulator [Nocardioides sp. KC13]